MTRLNESKNRGFGIWEAITIMGTPLLLCGGTYTLFKMAFVKQDITAQVIILGGATLLSVVLAFGFIILYKLIESRAAMHEAKQWRTYMTTQNSMADGFIKLSQNSQQNALQLQKQLTEAQKSRSSLPLPNAIPITFDAEYEEVE